MCVCVCGGREGSLWLCLEVCVYVYVFGCTSLPLLLPPLRRLVPLNVILFVAELQLKGGERKGKKREGEEGRERRGSKYHSKDGTEKGRREELIL